MTPKNRNDMWYEEYTNALTAFNIAVDRLRVAVDNMRSQNRILRTKSVEQKEDEEFTLEWLKDDSN